MPVTAVTVDSGAAAVETQPKDAAAAAGGVDTGSAAGLTGEARLAAMSAAVTTLLQAIGEDVHREGLEKTPRRVAKAMLETTEGYGKDAGAILRGALFDVDSTDMVIVQDIQFSSQCEHHMLPFFGRVHVGYIPTGKVVGLSKLARVTDVYAKRLQVQERLTKQIATALAENVGAAGVAVMIEASHMCMVMRGATKPGAFTTSTCYLGNFGGHGEEARSNREEFHRQIQGARRGF